MLAKAIGGAGGGGYTSIDIDFRDYSPAANGQKVSDAGITSGLATLTSASALFVSGDVGKACVGTGAGVAGANLHTTIAGYTNPTTITLTANASTTVSGANFSWGTDDTAKLQSAIDAANTAGNGRIIIPRNRYYFTGVLNWKRCTLSGAAHGPFEAAGSNPGKFTVGPTFMITNESTAFLTDASWHEPKIENIIFYYPNQVAPSASTPVVYPWTIDITNAGVAGVVVRNCLFVNSYNAINSLGGRHLFANLNIGSLNRGIVIDGCRDTIRINDIQFTPFWDTVNALGGGQPIDTWTYANATVLEIYSADLVFIQNLFALGKNIGIYISDSATYTTPYSNSYGIGTNINLDGMNFGIKVKSTNPTASIDWEFNGLQLGGSATGDTAVWLEAGGVSAPNVRINGGALWGTWPVPINVEAGKCRHVNVRGLSDVFRNFGNTDTTPSVIQGTLFKANNTLARTITSFDDGYTGQEIETVFTTANTTLNETGNIRLTGATTMTPAAGDSHRFRFDGTNWWHIGGGADLATFGIDGGAFTDTYVSTANVDGGAF